MNCEQMSCCPDGSWPALQAPQDYVPKGSVITLGNELPVYVVGESDSKAILVFPEVFCWEGRLKGVCDTFAEQGYFVIMPDIMRGDSMSNHSSSEETRMAFLKRWAQWEVVENDCNTIFRYLQEKGISSIGAIGFCWGVWMAFRASAAGFPLKAGAGCHPSIRLEQFSGGSEDQLSRSVKCPMALASARNDPDNVQTGGSVHAILSSLHPASEVRSFGEVDHGWVTRGDLNDEVVAKNVRDALQFCQDFFLSTL